MIFGSMPRPNNDGPELRDAAGAEPAAATSENETLIPLPGSGETIIVNLHGLTSAQFAFDPDIAQATVRGDDLVLSINGGVIVLVGYVEALRAGDLPTLVSPLGDEIFPDSLLNRGELARTISRLPAMAAVDPRSLLDVVDVPAGNPLHALIADTSIPARERVALAIAGPAFQWR